MYILKGITTQNFKYLVQITSQKSQIWNSFASEPIKFVMYMQKKKMLISYIKTEIIYLIHVSSCV